MTRDFLRDFNHCSGDLTQIIGLDNKRRHGVNNITKRAHPNAFFYKSLFYGLNPSTLQTQSRQLRLARIFDTWTLPGWAKLLGKLVFNGADLLKRGSLSNNSSEAKAAQRQKELPI